MTGHGPGLPGPVPPLASIEMTEDPAPASRKVKLACRDIWKLYGPRGERPAASLDEVRALLGLAGGGHASCAEVRNLAASHLKDVRTRIADLKRMERVLADSVRACDAGQDPGCPLIEALRAA